jgi:transposase
VNLKDTDALKEIQERLDVIIKLLALPIIQDKGTTKDKVRVLAELGLSNSQIASICGVSVNIVAARRSEINKEASVTSRPSSRRQDQSKSSTTVLKRTSTIEER